MCVWVILGTFRGFWGILGARSYVAEGILMVFGDFWGIWVLGALFPGLWFARFSGVLCGFSCFVSWVFDVFGFGDVAGLAL